MKRTILIVALVVSAFDFALGKSIIVENLQLRKQSSKLLCCDRCDYAYIDVKKYLTVFHRSISSILSVSSGQTFYDIFSVFTAVRVFFLVQLLALLFMPGSVHFHVFPEFTPLVLASLLPLMYVSY